MDIITIKPEQFYDFYDKLLNNMERERPWFYKEKESEFVIVILEPPILVMTKITKGSILKEIKDGSQESIDDTMQRWREGHLKFAIPFERLVRSDSGSDDK